MTERFWGLSARLWAFWAVLCFVLLGLFGIAQNTPTGDEHLHITRGLAWWWQDDARFSHAHPPLANVLQAIPAAATDEVWPFDQNVGWGSANVDRASRSYFSARKDARAAVVRGRFVTLFFAALFLLYVFLWLREHFSLPAAIAGAFLVGSHTTFLAAAQLVTTDFAVAALLFVVFGETFRLVNRQGWHQALRVGLLVGCAATAKHSAPLGIVIIAGLGLVYGLWRGPRYDLVRPARLKRLGKDLVLISVGALLVINLAYRFDNTLMTMGAVRETKEPAHALNRKGKDRVIAHGPFKVFPDVFPMPVPYMHIYGMSEVWVHSTGGHGSYFKGEVSRTGWWDYFPTMMFIKTPTGTLALFFLALFIIWRQRRRPPDAIVGLLVFSGLMLVPMMASSINIGARHALVVLVPLTVVAAWGAGHALQAWHSRRAKAIVTALLVSSVVGAYFVPDYLGDFNFLVGRENGHDISIMGEDWSQDTARFSRWAKKRKWKPLLYEPNSVGAIHEPKRYGVNYTQLNCKTMPDQTTYIAVHRARLYRRRGKACYPWMTEAKLIQVINDHIEVYHWTAPPGLAPAAPEKKKAQPARSSAKPAPAQPAPVKPGPAPKKAPGTPPSAPRGPSG